MGRAESSQQLSNMTSLGIILMIFLQLKYSFTILYHTSILMHCTWPVGLHSKLENWDNVGKLFPGEATVPLSMYHSLWWIALLTCWVWRQQLRSARKTCYTASVVLFQMEEGKDGHLLHEYGLCFLLIIWLFFTKQTGTHQLKNKPRHFLFIPALT